MGKMSSKQASQKKELGHAEERTFNAFFGNKSNRETNFSGANADNIITNSDYQKELSNVFEGLKSYMVSLKSGKTWQFHLGRIDELSSLEKVQLSKTKKEKTKVIHSISFKSQEQVLKDPKFWKKYLGKGYLLCYNDKEKKYTFFKMIDVINFIVNNAKWRILETGRIKGDFFYQEKNRAVITFEYRNKKKQFVIGAHGGKSGLLFFNILKENIKYHAINFNSKVSSLNFYLKKGKYNPKLKGKIGETFFDSSYLYICIEKNKWKRIALENITSSTT